MILKDDQVGSMDDAFNPVFVVDSDAFAFFHAEWYHRFHSDVCRTMGYFPDCYRRDLWQLQIDLGRIPFGGYGGCPDNCLKHC